MIKNRGAGILLHPISFPGNYGIGDLGENSHNFADLLKNMGQKYWQIFPLGPTGYGDSPYQCFSAFAGNPLLISPNELINEGLLDKEDIGDLNHINNSKIDYGKVIELKHLMYNKSFSKYFNSKIKNLDDFNSFCTENEYWLEDYSAFMAIKNNHGGKHWQEWPEKLKLNNNEAVENFCSENLDDVNYQKYIQFLFDKQWKKVRKKYNSLGIEIIGDIPIFVAYDSADVWANPELFSVKENGKLETVAGCPPDYFSATGQLWGNPLYNWDKLKETGFDWWIKRVQKIYDMVDHIRLDHFRGFESYWEIPADHDTAEHGKWIKAPGKDLFNTLKSNFSNLSIIAEDLGVITDEVDALREQFEFPGLKILQFAFGNDGAKNYLPHNYEKNCVVYTGTHDNETTRGFYNREKNSDSDIFSHTLEYLNVDEKNLVTELIRTAYNSSANTVLIPFQDILELGNEARMNFPGKLGGNWQWRFNWEQVTEERVKEIRKFSELYERLEEN